MMSPLSRRIASWLAPGFVAGAAALLAVSVWIGQAALHHEVEQSSLRMASLFESSLRNAMLQRDLDGLSRLIAHLGTLPRVQSAELLTPAGPALGLGHIAPGVARAVSHCAPAGRHGDHQILVTPTALQQ